MIRIPHRLRKSFVTGIIVCTFFNVVSGQDTLSLDSSVYTVLFDEVAILAPKRALSPISFESISVAESRISASERVDQYLNFIPGIEMQSGALNTNRIVFRGIGSRSPFATSKLRAYLDDIPLTDGIGETTIEDINLESISSLDVWKGPFISSYGAGLGGAIRYVSKNIASLDKYVKSEVTLGDFGYLRFDNTYSDKFGENSAILVNQEIVSSDGYRDNNDYNRSFTGITYKNIGRKYAITALLNHIDLNAQIPSSLNIEDFNNQPQAAAANWKSVEGYEDYRKTRLGLNYVYIFNDRSSISSTLYGYDYNSYELRPFNVLDDDSRAFSLRNIYTLKNDNQNLSIGQELYLESYNWKIFETIEARQGAQEEEGESKRRMLNLFAEYSHDLPINISIGTGFHLHYNSITLNEMFNGVETEKSYNPLISPRIFIKYDPARYFSSRLDIAHGYSNPGLDESLDADGRFNESIEQETGWNYDLGVSIRPSQMINVNLSVFTMNISDIIVNRQDNEGNIFGINAGMTRHRGLEATLNLSHHLGSKTTISFLGSGEIGDYEFLEFVDGNDDYSGNELTGVAADKLSFKVSFIHHSTTFLFTHRYVSSIPVNDANTVYAEGYNLSGFYFNQDISLGNITLSLSSEVDNIFNHKYASMVAVNARAFGSNLPRYYYPGLPLNGKFTLAVSYNFN